MQELIEAEILNSMIYYPNKINDFLKEVKIYYFSPIGQKILIKIIELQEKKALSLNSLSVSLGKEIVENKYFYNLLASPVNVDFNNLAVIFKKNYALNKQREIATKMLRACDANELLDLELLSRENEIKKDNILNFSEWLELKGKTIFKPKIKTNIDFLDSCFNGGIELGQLVLISGDAEAGKTMLGLQILENASISMPVCFFSFEFTIDSYLNRKRNMNNFNPQNLYIINDGYDLYEVVDNIKNLHKTGVNLFLIDSQMRLTSPNGRNMEEEESLKFSTLAKLCHSLDITIMLIIQTAKGDRHNPLGSKKGGHEASIIIRIEKDQKEEVERDIIIFKNKQTGKHPKDRVKLDRERLTFSKYDKKATQEVTLQDIGIEVTMPGIGINKC